MTKIRNFMYNISDIFLALIILAVASLLIWIRIDIIMAYPDTHAPTQNVQQSEPKNIDNPYSSNGLTEELDSLTPPDIEAPGALDGAIGGTPEDGTENPPSGGTTATPPADASGAGDASNGVVPPVAPVVTTIELPEAAAVELVASILHANGVISSPNDFAFMVNEMDGQNIFKSGSIEIPSGVSFNELIDLLTI